MLAIRNLCMIKYHHATTGSNMKQLFIYQGTSPRGRFLQCRTSRLALLFWLVAAPLTLVSSQVTITCPPAAHISCSSSTDPAFTGQATASTQCPLSGEVTITYQDNTTGMTGCMGTGTTKRTWTATDQCGNTATCVQNIIVEDNTSPTLTCPPFMVISCDTDTSAANLGYASASDNCTPANLIQITYTDHVQNLNQCNGTGTFTRYWEATDQCGNVALCIQTIVITDTQAPVLTVPANVTISCEQTTDVAETGLATATDNCTATNSIIINFSDNVLGLTGCNGTGTIVRTWTARDACNNISTGTQYITVQDNTPPQITCPPDITISCESSLSPAVTGDISASDFCSPVFTGYTDSPQLGCNGTGIIERTWTAIDGCGNLSQCIQWITITDSKTPVVTCPADITVDCAQGIAPAVTGTPVSSDNCTAGIDLITEFNDIEIVPSGCNQTGVIERTWTITDACGNSTSCKQLITITDLLNPTLTCPPAATISCESSVSPDITGYATASDNCTAEQEIVITYTDDTSLLFGCNGTGILNRTWSATDLCGNVSTCVQQIFIIDNIDPVITIPANVTISCDDPIDPVHLGAATATDNCTANPEINYNDTKQLNGCNQTGLIIRVWSAKDACGNSVTGTQLITVIDETAPIVIAPRDTMIDCGIYINPDVLGYPTGTDNCTPADDLVLAYTDDLSGLTGCTNTGIILRTWYMTDACGNRGSSIQRITIADTIPPAIVIPANAVVSCEDPVTPQFLGKATATDYCTASLFISITFEDDLSQAGQCNGSGFIYRTWKATDQCGNFATGVQTIEIRDDVSPELQIPASYAISCEVDRSPDAQGWARATDNCTADEAIVITYSDNESELTGCNYTGNLYRTWKATDACGNTTTAVQVLTITDTKAPVVTPPPAITVSCESSLDVSVTGNITATDNCTPGALLDVQISDDFTGVIGCNKTGTLKRTWIVSDLCGNSKSVTQTIRIEDSTPPSITCGDKLTVRCGESVDPSLLGKPTISDNCTPEAEMDLLHFDNTIGLTGCNGTGFIYRTWIVYDDCGNSNSCIQTIEVIDDMAPVITLPSNITISCEYAEDLDVLGRATAVDGCTPVEDIVITYSDNDSGLLFCNGTGLRQRVWKATDLCGNASTAIQYIQFIDTLGPIFYTPLDITIDCSDNPLDLEFTGEVRIYTDNCAPKESITIHWRDDLDATENCGTSNPVIRRIWTLTDPCGNSTSSVQRITINNYSMAQLQFPEDVHIPCDANMDDFSITGELLVPTNACAYLMDTMFHVEMGEVSPYLYERKWVYIDYCGDVVERMQRIYLDDNVRPEVTVKNIAVSFAQSPEVTITPEQVIEAISDNCDPELDIVLSQTVFNCESFLEQPQQIITLTATDDQGNSTIKQITISLDGGLFLIECPQNIVVQLGPGECSAEVSYSIAPIGLCNQTPIVQQIDASGRTSGDHFYVGTTPQVYAITDQLGYTMECAFTVQVLEHVGSPAMACNDTLHVSVVYDCQARITPDELLEGDHYGCYDDYIITFTNPAVQFEDGILYAEPFVGQYLEACITDPSTGNYCCSWLLIEDKLKPVLECSDVTISCTEDFKPETIPHFPVPQSSVVTPLGGNKYQATGIDNCGTVTLSYTDAQETFMCDGLYSMIITRTWTAMDKSGNTDVCSERIYLERGTIDDFVFPGDTTIECGHHCLRPDGTPDPDCIGTITGPFCGTFFKGYIDKVIPYCGGSYIVIREWSLVDWCNTENNIEYTQLIRVEDTTPPVIVCEENISLPADFGDCGAELVLTSPTAYDGCGSEPFTFALWVNGQSITPTGGEWRLPFLSIGNHNIVWEVTDACGNRSTCQSSMELYDNTPPVAYCDRHTVIAITNLDQKGIALLPATSLDDGSFDNCGPVTFRARRMASCIGFDWTTDGTNHTSNGIVDDYDRGLHYNSHVPFACCDAAVPYVLVELEVRDAHGNVNYCMVQVEVQDKVAPTIVCPPDITVSCDYWFDLNTLSLLSDRTFGTVIDGFQYPESARQPIIINDPGNTNLPQPYNWGLDGYASDNCDLTLSINVSVYEDCSGESLPGNPPDGAIKLIRRRFNATDPAGRSSFCIQNIWVVNHDPFYINSHNPNDPNDDVIWPADVISNTCAIPDTVYPVILNDGCAIIGINMKERRFEFVDGSCVKIFRDWTIIDWCQYNAEAGTGKWTYTQVVSITQDAGVLFPDCTTEIRTLCLADEGVTEIHETPFKGSCNVHLDIVKPIEDICSKTVKYDVKLFYPGSSTPITIVGTTFATINPDGTFNLRLNTTESADAIIRQHGLAYNNHQSPNEHYRLLWSVWDGCGNLTTCEDRLRLEDCKLPTPVCINGLSTVPMSGNGQVTIWAKDFNSGSYDNCTPDHQLRFSFSGSVYQPSKTYSCDDIEANGIQQQVEIWVWDNWNNRDYCTTSIIFTDPHDVCGFTTGGISGIVTTHTGQQTVSAVDIVLRSGGQTYGQVTTTVDGLYQFPVVPGGQWYTLDAGRNDNHRNGVNTLDLIRLQKHLLGEKPFDSPYLYIAADANSSQTVSAIDLVEIRKVIIGIHQTFPQSPSWRFIPENYDFINPNHPWPFTEQAGFMVDNQGVIEDFIAIKIGDLDNTVKANARDGLQPRSMASATFQAKNTWLNAGETAIVTFNLRNFDHVLWGGQWSFRLNNATLEQIEGILPNLSSDMWHVTGDEVRFSWVGDGQPVDEGIVSLRLSAQRSGWISDMIALDNAFLTSEVYDENEKAYALELNWRSDDDVTSADEVQLHQNHPNPWIDETVIPFEIPEASDVTLRVTNTLGEVVYEANATFAAGSNQFVLRNAQWPSGMYYYTLSAGDTQLTKTMLILSKH